MATAEDSDSPVAMKLKKMWLKTPVSEEQAAQAVLDPAIGKYKNLFLNIYFLAQYAIFKVHVSTIDMHRNFMHRSLPRDEPRGHKSKRKN